MDGRKISLQSVIESLNKPERVAVQIAREQG